MPIFKTKFRLHCTFFKNRQAFKARFPLKSGRAQTNFSILHAYKHQSLLVTELESKKSNKVTVLIFLKFQTTQFQKL